MVSLMNWKKKGEMEQGVEVRTGEWREALGLVMGVVIWG